MTTINLNDYVTVELTEQGSAQFRSARGYGHPGHLRIQLWALMRDFGPVMRGPDMQPFVNNAIDVEMVDAKRRDRLLLDAASVMERCVERLEYIESLVGREGPLELLHEHNEPLIRQARNLSQLCTELWPKGGPEIAESQQPSSGNKPESAIGKIMRKAGPLGERALAAMASVLEIDVKAAVASADHLAKVIAKDDVWALARDERLTLELKHDVNVVRCASPVTALTKIADALELEGNVTVADIETMAREMTSEAKIGGVLGEEFKPVDVAIRLMRELGLGLLGPDQDNPSTVFVTVARGSDSEDDERVIQMPIAELRKMLDDIGPDRTKQLSPALRSTIEPETYEKLVAELEDAEARAKKAEADIRQAKRVAVMLDERVEKAKKIRALAVCRVLGIPDHRAEDWDGVVLRLSRICREHAEWMAEVRRYGDPGDNLIRLLRVLADATAEDFDDRVSPEAVARGVIMAKELRYDRDYILGRSKGVTVRRIEVGNSEIDSAKLTEALEAQLAKRFSQEPNRFPLTNSNDVEWHALAVALAPNELLTRADLIERATEYRKQSIALDQIWRIVRCEGSEPRHPFIHGADDALNSVVMTVQVIVSAYQATASALGLAKSVKS